MVCRPGHENDPLEKMRHSCAHVMADAVTSLFPGTKVAIGPCIDDGFYYDSDVNRPFGPEDLQKIEQKMKEIVAQNFPFVRKEISKKEAVDFFKKRGEKYKVEIVEGLSGAEPITLYQHGDFVDLCKGPHLAKTGEIGSFHLLSIAGAYWRGDEKREMLQRIYGTAFGNEKDLKAYLARLEEANRRDHRKVGRELDLFSFHPEAPASPFFHPKGALLYRFLVDYIRGLYRMEGYEEVITPEIFDVTLWERSGHLEHFRDNMFFTEIENREMAVKPMNCPGHCLMFGEKKRSYRELPVRFADFGRLHRYERSGVTHGLTRVRTFSQDDAHIYCTRDQMAGEIQGFLRLIRLVYRDFGFSEVMLALATRPEHAIGSPEIWEEAESKLKKEMESAGLPYKINPGEGAFYGPKIEFQVKDALGRPWQLGTLQVDYSMPERFDLAYVNAEGKTERPVMLHRAMLGSIERFYAILIEHCGGAFPLWLAPVQTVLIPITDGQVEYAGQIKARLFKEGIRVEVDSRNEKLGLKIRENQLKKVPYMAVIGAKEVADKKLSVRHRSKGDLGLMSIESFLELVKKEIEEKV
ncbi:MAG: threonine--tRNA ligase [Deltaproteobacteria bacterium]|nr:threonine--tRNA ligase [Deltaproteobacteria bacterium]